MAGVEESQRLVFAGRYRRIRRLGTGGMARVFLAEDETLGRQVAVKQLPSEAPEEALRRFRREARLGASLNHPGIVSIYDSVSDEDSLLIVMEYVDGESLSERMRRGPLEHEEVLRILGQVAAALDHAHANGVLHRDVKPSNVLLSEAGAAKLADLGIATAVDATAITGTGNVIGTLAYIAPERLGGDGGEAAADIYSLATVAFEMLGGRRAHPERTPEQLLRRIGDGNAPDLRDAAPEAPAAAAELLMRAMSSRPPDRPASARELVEGLERALGAEPASEPVTATQPLTGAATANGAGGTAVEAGTAAGRRSFEPPPWERRRVPRGRLAALAALALAAGLLVGIILVSGDGGGDSAPIAERDGEGRETAKATAEPAPEPQFQPEPTPTPAAPPAEEPAEVASGTDSAALNEQGFALIEQGRYDEAVPVLQQAVDGVDPSGLTYAYALFNLGNALRLAGRPEEAIPVLEERLGIPNQRGIVKRELELAYADAGLEPPGGESRGGDEDDD